MSDHMTTAETHCPTCGAQFIPGFGTCTNCGETKQGGVLSFVLEDLPIYADDEPLPDHYTVPTLDSGGVWRACNEARALEYADDDTAIAVYERLTRTRTLAQRPYQRLAVLYRKRKAWADEERVVRLALAHIPSGPNSWFVLRLAKILALVPVSVGKCPEPGNFRGNGSESGVVSGGFGSISRRMAYGVL